MSAPQQQKFHTDDVKSIWNLVYLFIENQTNLHLEPHDYRIYYVNIDLRHQYGISVAEAQTFLLAKHP